MDLLLRFLVHLRSENRYPKARRFSVVMPIALHARKGPARQQARIKYSECMRHPISVKEYSSSWCKANGRLYKRAQQRVVAANVAVLLEFSRPRRGFTKSKVKQSAVQSRPYNWEIDGALRVDDGDRNTAAGWSMRRRLSHQPQYCSVATKPFSPR